MQAITPGAFEFQVSIMLLCMVVLGGAGSLRGVILGGMLITVFDRVVLSQTTFLVRWIGRTTGIPALDAIRSSSVPIRTFDPPAVAALHQNPTEPPASSATQTPIAAPIEPVAPGISVPLATVFNGGNVRAQPNIEGEVLDQIHARESVRLLAKTADARWYRIVNPRDLVGWVSATLLKIDPALVEAVPVADGS